MMRTENMRDVHLALQFGNIKHFNEGLSEFSRQLALQFASQARKLREESNWHFHFLLPRQWHGMFGDEVTYHDVTHKMRRVHEFKVPLDVWHGLHQHMRYRPPQNSGHNIITLHDLNHLNEKNGLSLWWHGLRLTRQLRRMNQVVAITQYVRQDMEQHMPWAAPVTVIHNGVADLTKLPMTKPTSFVPEGFLLHISRMSPSKNVASLIELANSWPEQNFLLVGPDSPEVEYHRNQAVQLGLKNTYFLTDVTEQQKAWLLANCKGFLFPSLHEGFGLPPVEAMYFGKPVIVADRTSLPEVCGLQAGYWQDFKPNNMRKQVEHRLLAFHQDPTLPQKVQQQALKYIWPNAAASYLEMYRNHIR